jgi:hypothetical protein
MDLMRHRLTTPLALLSVLLLLAVPGAAGDDPALGTWDIVASTPDGELPSVLTLFRVDGALKAELELGGTKREVSDESLAEGVLRMKVLYDGTLYSVEAKLDGDTMAGTWSGGGDTGTLKAKKRPAAS